MTSEQRARRGIIVETKRHAACPECDSGKVGSIDHLAGDEIRSVGPWFCDQCGRGWMMRTNGRDVCDLTPWTSERRMPVTVTLELPPQQSAIYLTLRAHRLVRPGDDLESDARYFYDQHTCPTNWMRDVFGIRIGDDADPHGLFRFVSIEEGHVERDLTTGNPKEDS